MPRTTTVGQLMLNAALPEDMRRDHFDINKGSIKELVRELALKHPDNFKDVMDRIMKLGHFSAQSSGTSVSLSALRQTDEIREKIAKLNQKVRDIANSDLTDQQKREQIILAVGREAPKIQDAIFQHGLKTGNPFALQAASGSRGNASQLQQLVAGDMLVQDHRDELLEIPVLRGYSQGLSPAEYFASSFGARKSTADTKFATRDSGFLSKQLTMATHRTVVTEEDCATSAGIRVDGNDSENIGSVLAQDVDTGDGIIPAGTILSPRDVKQIGDTPIIVRSVSTCQASSGVCAKCSGARSKGRLPDIGDNIGLPAAQAIGEKVSQGALNAKHKGATINVGSKITREIDKGGFDRLNQLVQVPSSFEDAAALATTDGHVTGIRDAPQGGQYIRVGDTDHYVPPNQKVLVRPGQEVEAGDVMSNGIPNPAEIVTYKGLGEGRQYFLKTFREALRASGQDTHRRNLEVLAKSLVNHVKITDPEGFDGFMPDDIVPYDVVRTRYQPREDAQKLNVSRARNMYLERPVLHYTIGTRITPRTIKDLQDAGIMEVEAHPDAPPFEPTMLRAMESALHDDNWMTRLGGSYLQKGFLDSVHRSKASPLHDTSFIPSLAEGSRFGDSLKHTGVY